MKRLLPILFLGSTLIAARADLVVEQKVESPFQNGNMTMKIKGEKIRVDMPTGPAGAMSSIVNLTTGDSLTLMHGQKMAMKTSGALAKQMIEQMQKKTETPAAAGAEAGAAGPKATGKTETVGEYQTEIYTVNIGGGTYTYWVAKDFPDYAKIKAEMDKVNQMASGGIAKGMGPDLGNLPGVAVKTRAEIGGTQITTTLVSAKSGPVDAALFEMPKGYTEMAAPTLPNIPAPAAPK